MLKPSSLAVERDGCLDLNPFHLTKCMERISTSMLHVCFHGLYPCRTLRWKGINSETANIEKKNARQTSLVGKKTLSSPEREWKPAMPSWTLLFQNIVTGHFKTPAVYFWRNGTLRLQEWFNETTDHPLNSRDP